MGCPVKGDLVQSAEHSVAVTATESGDVKGDTIVSTNFVMHQTDGLRDATSGNATLDDASRVLGHVRC